MASTERSVVIQVVSIVSAILTPLLVAFFGYYNSQKIEAVKTGYDYLQYKLEKLQDAYERTNIALDANLAQSISSQLQSRHHKTRDVWEMVSHYVSEEQSERVEEVREIGEKINQIYVEFARAQQKKEKYSIEDENEFSSLLYDYHEETRKILAQEILSVIQLLEEARSG